MQQPQRLCMENLRYLMGVLLFVPPPREILLLGVGGGSLVHFFLHSLPSARITAVDIDAELVAIAQQHLGLPEASAQLEYRFADARGFLAETQQAFDLIVVDIFDGGQSPPWLLQRDTLQLLKARLSPRGGVAFNLLIDSEKTFARFYRLLREVFQRQTLCLETADYENLLVYGRNLVAAPCAIDHWLERGAQLSSDIDLPFDRILATIYDINPVDSGII